MTACTNFIEPITDNECLGDSLPKINNNFSKLQEVLCGLKVRFDSRVEVRTFFYYGPNAQNSPISGMNDAETSRPSNMTIQAFVNAPTQLNLTSISKPNDVAYVIYQKTGFLNSRFQGPVTGIVDQYQYTTQFVRQSKFGRSSKFGVDVPVTTVTNQRSSAFTAVSEDLINYFAPVFIIWRLTYLPQGAYIVDSGFPKFVRAQTNSSQNAFNPQTWSTY